MASRLERMVLEFLVFVLGCLAVAAPLAATVPQPPVLLLPGLWSSDSTWDHVVAAGKRHYGWGDAKILDFRDGRKASYEAFVAGGATSHEPPADVYVLDFSSNDGLNLHEQAAEVGLAIDCIRKISGDPGLKVFLVGHSMGGLAARAHVVFDRRHDVAGVVTVGTPHAGSPLAFLYPPPGQRGPARAELEKSLARFSPGAVLGAQIRSSGEAMSFAASRALLEAVFRAVPDLPNLDSAAMHLLYPESPELMELNRAPLPPDVPFANLVFNAPKNGEPGSIARVASDLLGALAEAAAGKQLASGLDQRFNDGVVPVTSQTMQRLALPPYSNPDYNRHFWVKTATAFHVTLPQQLRVRATLPLGQEVTLDVPVEVPGELEQADLIFQALRAVGYRTAPSSSAPASTAPLSLSVALVVDSSGSMAKNDPRRLRVRAADLLVDRSPKETDFSVIDFDSTAHIVVRAERDHAAVEHALAGVDANGGTSICSGLRAALQALKASPGKRRAVVLFTDGQSTDVCGSKELAARGWPVYAVGLSAAADGALLQRLAGATGGQYVHALDAGQLQVLFDRVAGGLYDEATVLDTTGTVQQGAVKTIDINVDPLIHTLLLGLFWPGSDLDLTLVAPDGRRYPAKGTARATYELLRIDAPAHGHWRAEVRGVRVRAGGEPFHLRVSAQTPAHVRTAPPSHGLKTGNSLVALASLEDFPPGSPQVEVTLQGPGGKTVSSKAEVEGNTLRARFVGPTKPGPYVVHWKVKAGGMERAALATIWIGGAAFNPRVGKIIRVEGGYVRWNRGADHGMRPGLTVHFLRGGAQVGLGQVISVQKTESTVEVLTVTTVEELRVGDTVEVDPRQWVGEQR